MKSAHHEIPKKASSHFTKPVTPKQLSKLYRVRPAKPNEAAIVASIALEVNIHKYACHGKGFLVFTLTPDEYRKRILDGRQVRVFLLGEKIIGFICSYAKQKFEEYLVDGTLGHESMIGQSIQGFAAKRNDDYYEFLDQVAILPKYEDHGLGEIYFQIFCCQVKGPYYVAMVEGPLRNPRVDYWMSRGFIRVNQVEQKLASRFKYDRLEGHVSDRIQWGIFMLPNDGFRPVRLRAQSI